MNSGKVVLGVLAGLAAGAVLGILFAPEKGSKTRKRIMEKGGDYVDELKTKLDELSDAVTEKFHATKKETEALAQKGKATYDEAKNTVKNAVS